MKTTKILVGLALIMGGGTAPMVAQPVEDTREFCTPSSFGLADYNYVEDVEICKQVGVSSNGQATLSCKKAPLYQKDGQYYVKIPEATSKTKLEPAFKNGWYRNSSFSEHWTYSYQYKAGNWYFNL